MVLNGGSGIRSFFVWELLTKNKNGKLLKHYEVLGKQIYQNDR